MQISKSERAWVDLVKVGRLDEAYDLYLAQNSLFHVSKFLPLRRLAIALSYPFLCYIKMRKPNLSLSDTDADLSVEFLIFWKRPNLIGRLLLLKIIKSLFYKGTISARPLAWYAHWLVFQGKYKQSGYIFKYLISRVSRNSRLYGEILSLVGNHLYSRNKLEQSLHFHIRSNEILKENGDKFFQMFNIGTSAKSYAELGNVEEFNKYILESYDHLNPSEPDERYGMRVLIYSSYLNFISGRNDLAKQYYSSAEKCFLKSGSSLDKAIYCAYKAVILIFLKDLIGAREAIAEASLFLKNYGRYRTYEELISSIHGYLTTGKYNPRITKNFLMNDKSTLRSEIESWYGDFFSGLLPVLEKFQKEHIHRIKVPLAGLSQSFVSIKLIKSEVQMDDINDTKFEVEDSKDSTFFKLDIFHSDKQYELTLKSHYKKWRNPEIVEAIRSILVLLQNISRQGQLKNINSNQQQKVKESEVARRIAHDIRSPLAALNVAIMNLNPMVADYRIIKSSTQRIEDITNSLSRKINYDSQRTCDKLLMKSFLDTLIASKRFEILNSKSELKIIYEDDSTSKYINVNETELGRTLSNIINNALESYHEDGVVEVLVCSSHSMVSINVKDYGCGIDSKFVDRIFEKDFSSKKAGSGLGLYYAKQFVETNNGTIQVKTVVDQGTTVSIDLPISVPPKWIKTNLFLNTYENIIILDDFIPNIEMMKNHILKKCPHKNIMTFSNATDFLGMVDFERLKDSCFFIIDYDFVNSHLNGIDLIIKNGIQKNSVLATHHFEDQDVIKKCLKNEIKIIPKMIFDQISIHSEKPKVVIVDDERHIVKLLTRKLEPFCELHLFEEAEEFVNKVKTIQGNPYFFLDRNFRNSPLKGENLITSLKDMGNLKLFNISGDIGFHHRDAVKLDKSEILDMFI